MDLSGKWINELQSWMILDCDDQGNITGRYHSHVGNAKGEYPLRGSYDTSPEGDGDVLTFCVTWNNDEENSHAATAWVGQFQQDDDGDFITTTWVLVDATAEKDDWESTMIGQDLFRRTEKGWSPRRRASK